MWPQMHSKLSKSALNEQCLKWDSRPAWRTGRGGPIRREIWLRLPQRQTERERHTHTWSPLEPFDPRPQSTGQEAISEKCDLNSEQVWEPLQGFGWSLHGSGDWVNMCQCNCTDQHLFIQQCAESKDILGLICSLSGSGDKDVLTSYK